MRTWKGVVRQQDETDCAAACIATISRCHGKRIAVAKVRALAGTDQQGTSGVGIVRAAELLGFTCKGARSPNKTLKSDLPFPLIAHQTKATINHYVVVHGIHRRHVLVGDPSEGVVKMPLHEFTERWTGIFFILVPGENFGRERDRSDNFSRYLGMLVPHRKMLVEILVASLLLTVFGVTSAFYFRFLLDEVVFAGLPEALLALSVGYAIVIIFQVATSFARSLLVMHLANKIDAVLVLDYLQHLLKLPMGFFSSRKTGEILSRLGDAEVIRQIISGTTLGVILDVLMLVIGGFALFLFSNSLVGIAAVPVVISGVAAVALGRVFRRMLLAKAATDADKQAHFVETINGIATVKALSVEGHVFDQAERKILLSIHQGMRLGTLTNIQSSIQSFLSQISTLGVFWLGSWYIMNGKMSIGELISFNTLLGYFLGPLVRLITLQPELQQAAVAATRLSEVMDISSEEDSRNEEETTLVAGAISMTNVSFSYGTRGKTLDAVNLHIQEGQKVAFVGPSGSGKTTLTKLLMKFYTPDDGEISLGTNNIRDISTKSLRRFIGYVPQEVLLFSGTIAENIALGHPNPDPEQVYEAARLANAHDFISRLPDRFSTLVGERGASLSGGERQRIALARVIMRRPKILLLDEATSSLDSESESAIMETIKCLSSTMTIIAVAHRLSTISDFDEIHVLEGGRIVESGSSANLIEQEGAYYRMWKRQHGGLTL